MKKIILSVLFLSVFTIASVPIFVNAQTPQSGGTNNTATEQSGGTNNTTGMPKLTNPVKGINSIEDVLFKAVDIAIFLGVIIAVFMFIFIGFKLVMAQGEPKALGEAKNWFLAAVIGTAILIGSKVIVEVIKNTLTEAGVVKSELFKKP